ncbi:MAG: hypothetical protein ABSA44_12735 [Bacteroidota bacterium]|jgi:hypothetical protein
MEKESWKQFLSKIFLGELSKTAIAGLLATLNLPTILVLLVGKLQAILQELSNKPIIEWQWYVWFLLASFILSYSMLLILMTIYIHKFIVRKRTFFIFPYGGYNWKMWLLPQRVIRSPLPLCPKHGVELSVYGELDKSQKCPFCDISISEQDYYLSPIVKKAFMVGEAMLDGHYKTPKKIVGTKT